MAQRTMHKYEQESRKLGKQSFMYAWVLDDTEEERLVTGFCNFFLQVRIVHVHIDIIIGHLMDGGLLQPVLN